MRKILISLLIGSCVLFSFMSCQVLESILGTSSSSRSLVKDGRYIRIDGPKLEMAGSYDGVGIIEIIGNNYRLYDEGYNYLARGTIQMNKGNIELVELGLTAKTNGYDFWIGNTHFVYDNTIENFFTDYDNFL